ncbi:hypothetical protein SFC52_03115 [Niallia circulans]|jgi:hypothetical protein|uniref:hypothetical protein n=1 Tax=Niallia circulans TaxID=1397 RepID=UPI00113FD5B8|nr:hypothetical protein [Niallia circulans]MED5102091.1 hypothetical protein [Niallia circulans]
MSRKAYNNVHKLTITYTCNDKDNSFLVRFQEREGCWELPNTIRLLTTFKLQSGTGLSSVMTGGFSSRYLFKLKPDIFIVWELGWNHVFLL